ncbi:hypothetical protein DN412_36705 [Cupriavidus lacunae]|uniref:Uncharacterized protein n=1 Tax=Cupriavidus lacunae TaxID=2666307 RepID=A0A370NIT0_9BURK|nr:hypothetical protein DN412_36705 [Cupriavidus lacunae]
MAPIRLRARLLTTISEVSNLTASLLLVEIGSERRDINKGIIACSSDSRLRSTDNRRNPQMLNASE